jgi:hypothetical protein
MEIPMNRSRLLTSIVIFSDQSWELTPKNWQNTILKFGPHERVYFIEKYLSLKIELPRLILNEIFENLITITPHLPEGLNDMKIELALYDLMNQLIFEEEILEYTLVSTFPNGCNFSHDFQSFLCNDSKEKVFLSLEEFTDLIYRPKNC